MLNAFARDQGVADCLAKFAIDAKGFAELEKVYGHLPPEQFNAAVKARADQEFQRGGGIMDPLGVGRSPTAPAGNPTAVSGPTRIRQPSPNITLSREQLQSMPLEEVHKTLTGRFPAPQMPAAAPPPSMRPTAGPTAGTVAGRVNPLLAKH